MEKRMFAIITLLLGFYLAGCSRFSPESATPTASPAALITPTLRASATPAPGTATVPSPTATVVSVGRPDRIVISGVSVRYRDAIVIKGGSTLPDGSCILTRLFTSDDPVPWWPDQACAEVRNGGWLLVVKLTEEGETHELSEDVEYVVAAWSKDDPTVEAQPFPFDLQPPPDP